MTRRCNGNGLLRLPTKTIGLKQAYRTRNSPLDMVPEGAALPTNQRKSMNHKFDELAQRLAQCETRRQSRELSGFGVGLAGMALACLGLTIKAQADDYPTICDYANSLRCRATVPKHCPNYARCLAYCCGL